MIVMLGITVQDTVTDRSVEQGTIAQVAVEQHVKQDTLVREALDHYVVIF